MSDKIKITETPEREVSLVLLNDGLIIYARIDGANVPNERVTLSYAELAKIVNWVTADGQAQLVTGRIK